MVDGKHLVEAVLGSAGREDAGVVDEDVEAVEPRGQPRGGLADAREAREVDVLQLELSTWTQ